jgi:hypothetical protein
MLAGTRGGVAGSPGARTVPAWISLDSAEKVRLIDDPRTRTAALPRARRAPVPRARPVELRRMLQYIL